MKHPYVVNQYMRSNNIWIVGIYLHVKHVGGSFSFAIHDRNIVVERLFYHLPGEQFVYFKDDDDIDNIIGKPTIRESMFTIWMECNKKYLEAQVLT